MKRGKNMDEQEMKEFFADAVRAIERSTKPWRIATGVMALITVACLIKLIVG